MINSVWEFPKFNTKFFFSKRNKYCLCIPVINEGKRIVDELKKIHDLSIDKSIDVIICDGGSDDGSIDDDFLMKTGVRSKLVKTGPGKLSAQLRMGYCYAMSEGYEGVVTIDGNNKDSVENIPDFISALDDGFDFVQGSRFVFPGRPINNPLFRILAIRLMHAPLISILANFKYTDTTNGFRAYSKKIFLDNKIGIFRNIFSGYELLPYLSVRIPRLGYRVKEIGVFRTYSVGLKIPTKIHGFKGNFELLRILFRLFFNKYNPN